MICKAATGKFSKAGFILMGIMLVALSAAYGSELPAKTAKSSAQRDAKISPSEWNKVVEAAKKEGKLMMTADPSDLYRRMLVMPFEKKYPEIKIEYTGINGRDFRAKLLQERKVGQYLWDLRSSGLDPGDYEFIEQGIFDPIRSSILPEIADDSKWYGGFAYTFADKAQKYFPTAIYFTEYRVWINHDFIPEGQLNSSKQLLDPQFKGKMALLNPDGGSGMAAVQQLYTLYGERFVRDLFQKQGVVITSDKRQLVEWLIRGKYPIVLGLERGFLLDFRKKGLGQNVDFAKQSQDDSLKALRFVNKAPHPNAAKVYFNWTLSEEGQRELVKGIEGISMRKDVDPFEKELSLDPLSVTHRRLYEENVDIREKVQKLVRELVK